MRITQGAVSDSLAFFKDAFLNKYGLNNYYNPNQPAVFFGCYNKRDMAKLINHKNLALLVFGGTDAEKLKYKPNRLAYLKNDKKIRFAAISSFVENDLHNLGLSFVRVPVCPVPFGRFKNAPLGDCVYMYSSHKKPEKYNEYLGREVEKRMKGFKFIFNYDNGLGHIGQEDMESVYRKCFIGMRLTLHDGLPLTVIELGLMGRRCLYNGRIPNAIPWTNINDICEKIEKEYLERERLNTIKTSIETSRYIEIGQTWLETSRYWRE